MIGRRIAISNNILAHLSDFFLIRKAIIININEGNNIIEIIRTNNSK